MALFAAAVIVLIVRVAAWPDGPSWALFAAAALVAAASATVVAGRARPSLDAAATWIDVRTGASGAVVTEAELGATEWSDDADRRIPLALEQLPRDPWLASLSALAPALLFAFAAAWLPMPERLVGPPPAVAHRAIERLEEKLAALEETLDLSPELVEELHARLDRIQESADDGRIESTFEAVDRLGERLDLEAERALDAASRAAESLGEAASDPHLDHAREAFENALASLKDAGLDKGLPTDSARIDASLAELPEGASLSSTQLASASSALSKSLQEKLGRLGEARLIDASKLAQLKDLAPVELRDLAELAEVDLDHECDSECDKPGGKCSGRNARCGSGACVAVSSAPGRGGVSRGRADARLDFSGETPESAERFEEHALPPGGRLDLERSVLLGVGGAEPTVEPTAEGSGLVETEASVGDASWKRRLAPRHREAVRRFFDGAKD